jgi:hypothetical protein
VGSSRNPASVLESSGGGSKSEPSVDQKVLHTSKRVQKFASISGMFLMTTIFLQFSLFLFFNSTFFFYFRFSSNFGYLKISQQFQSFQVWGGGVVLWCRLGEVSIVVFFHFLNVKN